MTYIRQLCIILGISCLGELLHLLVPLPVPASVYGLLLMLGGLITGLIKLSSVKETGKFFVDIMPLLFVAPGVALMDSWVLLQPIWLSVLVTVLVSSFLVFAAAGLVTQWMMRRRQRKEGAQ